MGRTAMSSQPSLLDLLAEFKAARDEAALFNADTAPRDPHCTFQAIWYSDLIEYCTKAMRAPGFGTHVVARAAADIYDEKTSQDTLNLEVDSHSCLIFFGSQMCVTLRNFRLF